MVGDEPDEPAEIRRHRDELPTALSGRVIEIGGGARSNFGHDPTTAEKVVAVEPEPRFGNGRGPLPTVSRTRSRQSTAWPDEPPAADASFDAAELDTSVSASRACASSTGDDRL